jgi:hypothetical protein
MKLTWTSDESIQRGCAHIRFVGIEDSALGLLLSPDGLVLGLDCTGRHLRKGW